MQNILTNSFVLGSLKCFSSIYLSCLIIVYSLQSSGVEGLSVQRLTLLGRIHAAKVSIDMLTLTQTTSGDARSSKSKIPRRIPGDAKIKGKPPRPHEKR